VLRRAATAYDRLSVPMEWLLAAGAVVVRARTNEGKRGAVATYLEVWRSGDLEIANVDGIGRVAGTGWASLRHHAALWRVLRRSNAKFCEMLLLSRRAKYRALWRGYVPVSMSTWYRDPTGGLDRVMPRLEQLGWSFLDTDKIV
jgi:hypothetical protein